MVKNFADLLLDIEAGGLSGHESSIYSISFGKGQDIRTLAARPVPGTYISSWAAQNVWKPLQTSGMPLRTEREALERFASVLEANKGKTLAGWNIGYQAASQEIGRTSVGFDIPMLMTRAKEYGLESRYRSAFQGVKVRDVGQETALRLAKIVGQKKYQALVDPALWEQARSYKERGWEFQRAGATHQAEAKYIATQGYKFAGWKQSTVYELLTGRVPEVTHQSASDIRSLQEIMDIPLTGLSAGKELSLVQRWNTLALRDKALASNRPIETLSKIRDWSSVENAWKFAGRHKLATGAIGFLGIALGISAFSGKDDNYNVIEGLGHQGIAPKLRRQNTDFGSGYKGQKEEDSGLSLASKFTIVNPLILATGYFGFRKFGRKNRGIVTLPESLQPYVKNIGGFTSNPIEAFSKVLIPTFKEIVTNPHITPETITQNLKDLGKLGIGLMRSPYKHSIWINPMAVREVVKLQQGRYSFPQMLKGVVKHERFHQYSVEKGFRPDLQKLESMVPESFQNVYKEKKLGRLGLMTEEYLAYSLSFRGKNIPLETSGMFSMAKAIFSGKDDAWNIIEGLGHKGLAPKLRKLLTHFGSGYQGDTSDQRYQIKVQGIFKELAKALPKYGREVGTGHQRIAIPQSVLSQEDIEKVLGFVPVNIAIPESGQTEFESWRHPENLYHIHKHEDLWLMHNDRYEAATMTALAAKRKGDTSFLTKAEAYLGGMPHVLTEGIPGLYYYLKGQVTGGEDMVRRVLEELPGEYYFLVNKLERTKQGVVRRSESFYGRAKAQVKKWIGNTFSGKDDEYNTIEGLSHKGIAWQMRREMTDFGSGWLGRFSQWTAGKFLSARISVGRRFGSKLFPKRIRTGQSWWTPEIELSGLSQKEIISSARSAQKISAEAFAQSLGVELRSELSGLGTFSGVTKRADLGSGPWQSFVSSNPNDVYRHFTKILASATKDFQGAKGVLKDPQKRIALKVQFQNPSFKQEWLADWKQIVGLHRLNKSFQFVSPIELQKVTIFHEAMEQRNLYVLEKQGLIDKFGIRETSSKGGFSRLFEGQTQELAPSHWMAITQEELFLRHFNPQLHHAFAGLRKSLEGFSGFDDAYNTIEGLRHGNLASDLRKILTDFGSGFKGVIKIPELLGKIFEGTLGKRIAGEQLTRTELTGFWGAFRGQAKQTMRGLSKSERITLGRSIKTLSGQIREAQASKFQGIAFVSESGAKEQARVLGVPLKEVMTGTQSHETIHMAFSELGLRETIRKASLPQLESGMREWVKGAGRGYADNPYVMEEYLAAAVEAQHYTRVPTSLAELAKAETGLMTLEQRLAPLQQAQAAVSKLPQFTPEDLLARRGELRSEFMEALGIPPGPKTPPPLPSQRPPPLPLQVKKQVARQQLHNIAMQAPARMAKDAGRRHLGQAGKDWYNK